MPPVATLISAQETLQAREHLTRIYHACVARVDPYRMIADRLRMRGDSLSITTESEPVEISLAAIDRVVVVGGGKATAPMAQAIEDLFGERISDGAIAVKPGHTAPLRRIRCIDAGHPVPDHGSVAAAREILRLCHEADGRSLVIGLFSGGGSALMAAPTEGVSLADKQVVTKLLLGCGATIYETNAVRKHLSAIKGGRLAGITSPAMSVNLFLSDVVGDRLDTIASGQTTWDETTFAAAAGVLHRYDLLKKVPTAVRLVIEAGQRGELPETPKQGDPVFRSVHNLLIGTLRAGLLSAAQAARELGYATTLLSARVTGEAREIARMYLGMALDLAGEPLQLHRPACIIAGGETTVTLTGVGKGGRNQEMALAFLAGMGQEPAETTQGAYFLAASTDGNDGPTDAAGAFADSDLVRQARDAGLDPWEFLARNDSYHFHDRLGSSFKPGPTRTNVCDLQVILAP